MQYYYNIINESKHHYFSINSLWRTDSLINIFAAHRTSFIVLGGLAEDEERVYLEEGEEGLARYREETAAAAAEQMAVGLTVEAVAGGSPRGENIPEDEISNSTGPSHKVQSCCAITCILQNHFDNGQLVNCLINELTIWFICITILYGKYYRM